MSNESSSHHQSPPRLLRTLLTLALPAGIVGEAIRDDLDEEFIERAATRSPDAARRWYRRQALGVFLRYALFRNLRRRLRLPAGARVETSHKPPRGTLGPDLTYALRALWRNPGFSAIAIVTLALGIAATTATFSVVDTVMFRPLDLPEPQNVVQIWDQYPGRPNRAGVGVSTPNFLDYAGQDGIFQDVALVGGLVWYRQVEDRFEEVSTLVVTAGFFPLMEVEPLLGRVFLPTEGEPDSELVAMLSYGYWQREFGGDPGAVGRALYVRRPGSETRGLVDIPCTIVGVLPPDFRPSPVALSGGEEITTYMDPDILVLGRIGRNDRRAARGLHMFARLAPGVTALQAQAAMDGVAAGIAERFPETHSGYRVVVMPLPALIRQAYGTGLYLLWGAAVLVLLVAGVNVANLLLSRAAVREQEMAVRATLGAGRGRLLRQLLTESLILGLAGGLLALPLASAGIRVLVASFPGRIFRLSQVSVDLRVLIFLTALSVVAGLLFGLWPAARSARPDLTAALKEGARGSAGIRLRSLRALVVVQVAAAVLLVTGGGLLVRTYWGLAHVDPGFNVENLLTLRMATSSFMSRFETPEERAALFPRVRERLEGLPGVVSVGATTTPLLLGREPGARFTLADRPRPPRDEVETGFWGKVTPGYLETLQVPLLSGRTLTEADAETQLMNRSVNNRNPPLTLEEKREWLRDSELAVIVNQTMAQRYWPDEGALGKTLYWCDQDPETVDDGEWSDQCPLPILLRIVGIVGDVRMGPLDQATAPHFITPQNFGGGIFLAIRTSSDPLDMAELVRREIEAVDPELTVSRIDTMEGRLAWLVAEERFRMLLVGVFAAVATLLAAVGLFGVMAYAVSRRTHEIGIRMSLGAHYEDVLRLIGGQGMGLVVLGTVLGLLGAAASTRYLASLLYGVTPLDPATYLASALLLVSVAGVACWLPTKRAIRVDPVEALRSE